MEISQQDFDRFEKAMQAAQQKILELTVLLAKAEERLNINAEILRKSTEDIHVLVAFIRSKGLKPPEIQTIIN